MSTVFARVDGNGAVLQWPVLPVHIDNSGLPLRFFEPVHPSAVPAHNRVVQYAVQRQPQRVAGALREQWEVADLPIENIRSSLKAHLADLRWRREVGGITLPDETAVPTDRHTQSKLTGAVVQVQTSGVTELRWKLDTGFVTLTAAQITAIATAVAGHVAACFAAEADVVAAIDAAGTIAELAAIDVAAEFEAAMTRA